MPLRASRGWARGRARARRGRGGRGEESDAEVEQSHNGESHHSQSTNGDEDDDQEMKLKDWLSLSAGDFHGTGTPMEASSWLNTMEKYMEALELSSRKRVLFVAFQLKGLADAWWRGVRAAHVPVHGQPNWEFFVEKFTSRYYLESFKEEMFIALTQIEQGDKSVDEYEAELSKMVLFVDRVNENEAHKAQAFFRGLQSRYREVMGAKPQTSYSEVIEQARRMELEFRVTASRKGGVGDRKRSHQGGSGPTHQSELKKSKSGAHSQPNQSGAHPFSAPHSNSTSFIRPIPGQGLICFKCGQGHRASECDFSGSCDHCGKTGHMKRVCKKNPNSIIKWQLTSPSAGPTVAISSDDVSSRVRSSHGSVQMMATSPATPLQFPPHPHQIPNLGYYYHAPALPVPYGQLQLPAPPQTQQSVVDASTSMSVGVYNKPTSSSQGHHDGALGLRISGADINSSVECRG
ncbi:hypothetical protein ACQ4PT_051657 [Festuca glaucescens]